jgi:hypothetical protein
MSPTGRHRKNKKNKGDVLPQKDIIQITPIIPTDCIEENKKEDLTSPYERHIHFYSNCRNVEKTHVKDIKPQTYYFCSKCMTFHIIRAVG